MCLLFRRGFCWGCRAGTRAGDDRRMQIDREGDFVVSGFSRWFSRTLSGSSSTFILTEVWSGISAVLLWSYCVSECGCKGRLSSFPISLRLILTTAQCFAQVVPWECPDWCLVCVYLSVCISVMCNWSSYGLRFAVFTWMNLMCFTTLGPCAEGHPHHWCILRLFLFIINSIHVQLNGDLYVCINLPVF